MFGDGARATAHAREVLRRGRGPNGTDLAPMRMAEARIASGCVAARNGDLDEAVDHGTRAFGGDRKCFLSLVHAAGELDARLRERYAGTPQARAFHDRLRALRAARNDR